MKIVRNSKRPPGPQVHPPVTMEERAAEARIDDDEAIFAAVTAAGGEVVAETDETVTVTIPKPGKKRMSLVPAETGKQMLLFSPFFHDEHNRTLTTADMFNRYVLTKRRNLHGSKTKLSRTFFAKGGKSSITAAILPDGDQVTFPGAFEQLVELILRKLTVEQRAEMGLWSEKKNPDIHHVSVVFSLSDLRRRLAEAGSDRKLSEIREALEVMSRCNWTVESDVSPDFVRDLRGPILRIEATQKEKRGDNKGEKEMYLGYWHPLIAEAILTADYFLLDAGIIRLKDPLARWILNRMNARYRQSGKGDAIEGRGYTLSLETILAESGISAESRLRDTLDRVRGALAELKEHGFLSVIRAYEEQPTYERTQRRPKVVTMTWILYPSNSFSQSVIEGNREARLRITRGK